MPTPSAVVPVAAHALVAPGSEREGQAEAGWGRLYFSVSLQAWLPRQSGNSSRQLRPPFRGCPPRAMALCRACGSAEEAAAAAVWAAGQQLLPKASDTDPDTASAMGDAARGGLDSGAFDVQTRSCAGFTP